LAIIREDNGKVWWTDPNLGILLMGIAIPLAWNKSFKSKSGRVPIPTSEIFFPVVEDQQKKGVTDSWEKADSRKDKVDEQIDGTAEHDEDRYWGEDQTEEHQTDFATGSHFSVVGWVIYARNRVNMLMSWDATCVDSLAISYLESTSAKAGAAAEKAALKKTNKYVNIIENNYIFVPVAIETFGPWCSAGIDFINKLGDLINLVTCEQKSKLYVKQKLSLAIQRGNAACVMGTFNKQGAMDEIFYIL